jgi:hypothetical protein
MQKRFALAALSACAAFMLMQNANAITVCPFTDHFFIQAPLPLRVLNTNIEGNLNFTSMSENYFRLSCRDARVFSGGIATVDIGMTNELKCTVKIQDGPYQMNPSVKEADCGGPAARLYYIGMDHPYGSSDYYLKVTM